MYIVVAKPKGSYMPQVLYYIILNLLTLRISFVQSDSPREQ